MPKSSPQKLRFQKKYNAEAENIRKRVLNNQARAEAMKNGLVHKGDGLEVDHKKMLDAGGTNADGNLRVIPAKKNRGWRKTKGSMYGD
jgi:hypothetical protein